MLLFRKKIKKCFPLSAFGSEAAVTWTGRQRSESTRERAREVKGAGPVEGERGNMRK